MHKCSIYRIPKIGMPSILTWHECVCLRERARTPVCTARIDISQTLLPCTSTNNHVGWKKNVSHFYRWPQSSQRWQRWKQKNQCNVVILICAQLPIARMCNMSCIILLSCAVRFIWSVCSCWACVRLVCARYALCSLRMVNVVVVHRQQYPDFGHRTPNIFGEGSQDNRTHSILVSRRVSFVYCKRII